MIGKLHKAFGQNELWHYDRLELAECLLEKGELVTYSLFKEIVMKPEHKDAMARYQKYYDRHKDLKIKELDSICRGLIELLQKQTNIQYPSPDRPPPPDRR